LSGTRLSKGIIKLIIGADPAAGVEIIETVPAGKIWKVISVMIPFTTSAVAGNRRVNLHIDDGTTPFEAINGDLDQPASLTNTYNFFQGAPRDTAFNNSRLLLPLPINLTLLGGHRIITVTVSLDAGDNYDAPLILVEESDE